MIKTDRIMFVGDPHLDSSTPSSRIDDYAQSSLDKLEALRRLCLTAEVKCVVILGDVFNKHDQSNTYLNRVMNEFLSFKESGISVYSIVGNHDISYERIDTLDRSPLKMLFTSGLIQHLTEEEIDTGLGYTVKMYGLDYPDEPEPVSSKSDAGTLNILVAHRFFNYAFNDPHNLRTDQCVQLGYNVYALGHDHIRYEKYDIPNGMVLRPGSFMRTSSHSYNLEREISVDIVKFGGNKDTPQLQYLRKNVPSKPANEVFSSFIYQRSSDRIIEAEMESLSVRVNDLLGKMEKRENGESVFDVLDRLCPVEDEVKSSVETYLNQAGYFREKEG